VRAYETLSQDTERTMVRIKALYRSRGIRTPGRGVYQASQREQWLKQLTEPGLRQRVSLLYAELDQLRPLRKQAKQAMLAESRKHRAVTLLRTIPQLGPIRSARIVATRGYTASFSNEASTLELRGAGRGDAYELGIRDP
jgi:transposase